MMIEQLNIYVPKPDCRSLGHVMPGSGIIGRAEETDGLLTVYFEGNKYNFSNVNTWADRLYIAASRCVTTYPTIAKAMVKPGDVIVVGYGGWATTTLSYVHITDWPALARWLGRSVAALDPELARTGRVSFDA